MSGRISNSAIGLGDAEPLPSADDIRARFFAEHERSYGFHNPADPVEIVNFRLIAAGSCASPCRAPGGRARAAQPQAATAPSGLVRGRRAQDTPVYDRATLLPGDTIAGPAVIEQLDSTTLLFPGDRLRSTPTST